MPSSLLLLLLLVPTFMLPFNFDSHHKGNNKLCLSDSLLFASIVAHFVYTSIRFGNYMWPCIQSYSTCVVSFLVFLSLFLTLLRSTNDTTYVFLLLLLLLHHSHLPFACLVLLLLLLSLSITRGPAQ